jgi:GNAT superfamily N-acetyltransferase
MSEPRLLVPRDVSDLWTLSRQAGWNQTERDWLRLLQLEPEGCFGIESDGRIVSSTTVTCYGQDLAWIGMVLTDSRFRGQGYAGRLMRHALDDLKRRGIAWIKLDATGMGRPIYARLGFREECAIERWKRPAAQLPSPSLRPGKYESQNELDMAAFGASRAALLVSLAGSGASSVSGEGFSMVRPGAIAAYFGPCVARSAEAAERMLLGSLSEYQRNDVFWDLLPANREALTLAKEYGFEPVRHLVRMGMPGRDGVAPLHKDDSLVFAIAGFEFG